MDVGTYTHRNLRPNPRNYSLSIINCPTPIPSVEGCRPQAAGWFPAPSATRPRNPRPNPTSLIFDIC
ncbi:MAG: hypothetical protein LBM98_00110 [Oscillospiraceae bacterium]|nr:hypothetical protein [Oscillospiraceae bacterium]